MAKTDVTEQPEPTEQSDKAKLKRAYSAATSVLRTRHQDEFNTIYQKEAADRGIEWHPKLNPLQKARQEMRALLTEFPELALEFAQAEPEPDPEPVP